MYLRWNFVLLTGLFFATSCGSSSDDCPGLCPTDSIHPTMTIEVEDGTASVASARIVSGPCAHLLIRSNGEAGPATGYAAVQITYNGSVDPPPPLCMVDVTSLNGDTVRVQMQVTMNSYEQPCCPFGSCCPKTNVISHHNRVVFDEPAPTIIFPTPSDGGGGDLPQGTNDSSVVNEANGTDSGTMDASDETGGGFVDKGNEVDGGFIDASAEEAQDAGVLVDAVVDI